MTVTDQQPELLPDLADTLEAWENATQDARDPSAGPSDVGRCRRQVGYRVTGTPADTEHDDDRSAAVVGSLLHLAVAEVRRELYPAALVEAPVRVPGLDRDGVVDAYAGGVVDDVKSASCHVWDRIVASGQPRPGDVAQAGVYALGLEDAGHQVTVLTISYLNRCSGSVWTTRTPWTPEQRELALAGLLRLHAVLDAAEQGQLFPQDEPHPRARACELCPFQRRCWQLDSAPAEHTGPLTGERELAEQRLAAGVEELDDRDVAADPLPEQLAAKARRHVELGELLAQLDDERRAIAQELRGWQGARFTDPAGIVRRVAWTNPGPARMVDDGVAAAARLRELGEEPPTMKGRSTSPALHLRPLAQPKRKRTTTTKLEG